jgi:hypothetical protein
MQEALPFLFGVVIGVVYTRLPAKARPFGPVACIVVGAIASAINGELHEGTWALFISLDALLVWLGAAAAVAVVRLAVEPATSRR